MTATTHFAPPLGGMRSQELFQHYQNWIVIGTNFTKANTQLRSSFAITHSNVESVYAKAASLGFKDFFVLSTCNRTEFYGCSPQVVMRELILNQFHLSAEQLENFFYTYTGPEAIRHLFKVTAGLDSQIIGDYEIAGQVKKAVQLSRQFGLIQTLSDRITSYAFQASKAVKAKTNVSSGKYSVSSAASELMASYRAECLVENILIVGTGEMGQVMAKNLKEHFPDCKLSLTNRTLEHAQKLAAQVRANVLSFATFTNHLNEFDVVIAAAESNQHLIRLNDLPCGCRCLMLDLSIPQVIDPGVKTRDGIKLYAVDEISVFHNELRKLRQHEIPKAEVILQEYVERLAGWQAISQYSDLVQSYKEKLRRVVTGTGPAVEIEKVLSGLMRQIRSEGYHGCSVILVVNELMTYQKK